MRKITTLFTIMAMAVMSLCLTGCDEDDEMISYDLEGVWEGEIVSGYYNRFGQYRESYTETQIEFYNNPYKYASGRGREIDFAGWGRTEVSNFRYTVRNGVIYLEYNDAGSDVAIYNWRMYGNRFEGEFHDYDTGEYLASFRLYKTSSWDYGYSRAKSRAASKSAAAKGQ